MRIAMEEFLRTGTIGGCGIGSTLGDLEHAFGPPDDYANPQRGRSFPSIVKYGDIEFHTGEAPNVLLIHCDDFRELNFGSSRDFDAWFFSPFLSVEVVVGHLSTAGISTQYREPPYDETQAHLCLESGVVLMFCKKVEEFSHPLCEGLFGFSLAAATAE